MSLRFSRLACTAGLAGLLMSGCSAGGSSFEVSQVDLLGTWTNSAGARLVIEKEGTFSSEKIAKAISLSDGCAQSLAAGKWLLMGGETNVATTGDPKGSDIVLRPRGNSDQMAACSILASVKKDDRGINLCLVEDPDQTCEGGDLLRKSPTG